MSKEITKSNTDQQKALALVQTSLTGDWSKVDKNLKAAFLQKLCNELNIPLALNPFRFISMKGGEKLYIPAEGAALIGAYNNASVKILEKNYDKDTQILSYRVSCTNGHKTVEDEAHLYVGGTTGEARANAHMKCVTKAKRRVILSAFGLSISEQSDEEPQKLTSEDVKFTLPEINEDKQAQLELVDCLTKDKGMNMKQASDFVLNQCEKPISELSAQDCQEVLAGLDEEIAPEQSVADVQ